MRLTHALLLGTALVAFAQDRPVIPWLSRAPKVDGRLDPDLATLPPLPLKDETGTKPAELRVAADAEALYVHLRSPQAELSCRDRAYQNGDGLVLVLATPDPGGGPSRRFRVLGFSPQPDGTRNWQYAFTWYRDVDLQMSPLPGAQFAWHHDGGVLEFELRLPWTALAPYHPLLSPEIGLNACFARAEGEGRRLLMLKADPGIHSEQRPRISLPFRFAPPAPEPGPSPWFARPAEGHPESGAPLRLEVGASGAVDLKLRLLEGEGSPAMPWIPLQIPAGPGPRILEVPIPPIPSGGYQVEIQGPGRRLVWGFSTLPAGGVPGLRRRLEALAPRLSPGSSATLRFALQDSERLLERMAPTDPAPELRRRLIQIDTDLRSLEGGQDPFPLKRGLLRRAYQSALDGSLQPYTLRIPEALDPKGRHPLLVYLHGSGQDDQGVLEPRRSPAGWFELAPFGRGTSNGFSADHAQDDLREAIADVLAHYPVDPARIVLAGFSMGGYGVYRTAFERPGFFRALAVFSGVPDLGPRWLGPGHPDFLDPSTLPAFRGVPIFVFHGTADRNCPFEKTQRLVEALRRAGARVEFVTEAGKGHEAPSPTTQAAFLRWLEQQAGSPVEGNGGR